MHRSQNLQDSVFSPLYETLGLNSGHLIWEQHHFLLRLLTDPRLGYFSKSWDLHFPGGCVLPWWLAFMMCERGWSTGSAFKNSALPEDPDGSSLLISQVPGELTPSSDTKQAHM